MSKCEFGPKSLFAVSLLEMRYMGVCVLPRQPAALVIFVYALGAKRGQIALVMLKVSPLLKEFFFLSSVFWKKTFQSQTSHVTLNGNHFALTLRLPLSVLSAEEEEKKKPAHQSQRHDINTTEEFLLSFCPSDSSHIPQLQFLSHCTKTRIEKLNVNGLSSPVPSLPAVNKHKPWIETSYHGVITENLDTVLLDPPLVALDKDAPVPYAGRKNKCTLTHGSTLTHII